VLSKQRFNLGQYFLTVHGSSPFVIISCWHHRPAPRQREAIAVATARWHGDLGSLQPPGDPGAVKARHVAQLCHPA
jgi:hypothetical protein